MNRTHEVLEPSARPKRSVGELLGDMARDTSALVRQEIQLARAEMAEIGKHAAADAAYVGVGGLIAFIGALVLVAAGVLGLGEAIPYWASALIIGIVIALGGVATLLYGMTRLRKMSLVPNRTIGSVEQNSRAIKEAVQWSSERH